MIVTETQAAMASSSSTNHNLNLQVVVPSPPPDTNDPLPTASYLAAYGRYKQEDVQEMRDQLTRIEQYLWMVRTIPVARFICDAYCKVDNTSRRPKEAAWILNELLCYAAGLSKLDTVHGHN